MQLQKNEFTTKCFLNHLKKQFGQKVSGEQFTGNDVAQYLIRGYTPYRYGFIKISSQIIHGVRIITIESKDKVKK